MIYTIPFPFICIYASELLALLASSSFCPSSVALASSDDFSSLIAAFCCSWSSGSSSPSLSISSHYPVVFIISVVLLFLVMTSIVVVIIGSFDSIFSVSSTFWSWRCLSWACSLFRVPFSIIWRMCGWKKAWIWMIPIHLRCLQWQLMQICLSIQLTSHYI